MSQPEKSAARKRMIRFGPEQGLLVLRLSDPQISPDGSRVAFVTAPVAQSGEHPTSEIWIVPFEGGDARRFTQPGHADAAPRWSPDGKWLAFTSDREEPEKPQLYRMAVAGGEAIRMTSRTSSVTSPEWSPDGSYISFLSADEESEAERKDKKERRDQVVVDEDLKRNRLYVIPAEGGEPVQLSPDGPLNVWDYAWSPGGRRIAIITSPTRRESDYRLPHRMLIGEIGRSPVPGAEGVLEPQPPATESWRELLTFDSAIEQPLFSPDGERIAFLAREGRIVTGDALYTVSVATGEFGLVRPEYAGSVLSMDWDGDGSLVFSALENLHGAINSIEITTKRMRSRLTTAQRGTGSFGSDLALGPDRRLAVVRSRVDEPPELWTGILGSTLSPVTNLNSKLRDVRLTPGVAVSWKARDGEVIHGLLMEPVVTAGPFATILLIHGGPASAFSDRFMGNWHDWAQLLTASGYAVLMPNPRGSTGRGAAFTEANVLDLGGREFEDDMAGLDMLIDRGIADPDRLGIGGWSHGGYITAWAVTQTDRFKAAVMGAGVSNMISDQGTNDIPGFNLDYFYDSYESLYADPALLWDRSPMKYITNVTTPTLVLHGEKDNRVAASQGLEFYQALKALGRPTQMVIYPREPHGIREREHQLDLQRRVLEWFRRYLPA